MLVLILMAITPFTKAFVDYQNMVNSSQDSSDVLMGSNADEGKAIVLSNYPSIVGYQMPELNNKEKDIQFFKETYKKSTIPDDTIGSWAANPKLNSNPNYLYVDGSTNDLGPANENIASGNPILDIGSNLNYLYESESSIGNNRYAAKAQTTSQSSVLEIDSNLNSLYDRGTSSDSLVSINRIASQNHISDIRSNLDYLYQKRSLNDNDRIISQNLVSDVKSNLDYLYQKKSLNDNERIISQNLVSDVKSNLDYLYQKSRSDNDRVITNTNISSQNIYLEFEKAISHLEKDNGINKSDINPKTSGSYLYQLCEGSKRDPIDKDYAVSDINTLLESLVYNKSDINKEIFPLYLSNTNYWELQNEISDSTNAKSPKNYAVVVGINDYADRTGLHASVNDANSLGRILKSFGYEVIELTDVAESKPTKHNILEGALKEIELKKNKGNVVFYFSGHGDVDNKGNFYIIPQDGNGDPSSYISEGEIYQYAKGIKNLAIIIDACNSGAFKMAKGKDQLVMTSSKENEPSNENWTTPISVFTYYLCQAIEKEDQLNKEIIMQRAFSIAYNETLVWSTSHLVHQTPSLVDTTDGQYYLN